MTTNEIVATARRKILESGDEIITDEIVLQYANEEYRQIRKKLKMSNEVISATLVCSNGVCTLPSDYGAMYTFAVDANNNFYYEVSIADFEVANFDYGFTIESGTMKVNQTDIASIDVKYYPSAAVLTSIQNPEIDEMFHECIMYGTVSRLQEDLQDEELATYYRNKADGEFTLKSEVQSSYEEGNQRGGEMFVPQNLIS